MADERYDVGGAEVDAEDFAQIRDSVREWVRTRVIPRERDRRRRRHPRRPATAGQGHGPVRFAIPQEFGGLGLDLAQDVELAMELGYTSWRSGRCSAPTTASPGRFW